MNIGQRIRELREQREISQRELARRCGATSHSTISRIEADEINPTIDTVCEIAHALNVSLEELVKSSLREEIETHEKILIPKGQPFKLEKTYPAAGRITGDIRAKLDFIKSQTFLSESQIVGEMIAFAIGHIKIVDADIYFKNRR